MTNEQVREIEALHEVIEAAEDALPKGFRVDAEHTLEECIELLARDRQRAWTAARRRREQLEERA